MNDHSAVASGTLRDLLFDAEIGYITNDGSWKKNEIFHDFQVREPRYDLSIIF
jgi:hypothetical protein